MAFNGIKLPIPSATSRSTFPIKEFKGLDKASGEDNFQPSRAVEMKNFIRDKVGVVKKRGGFEGNKLEDRKKIYWIDFWNGYEIRYEGDDDNKWISFTMSDDVTGGKTVCSDDMLSTNDQSVDLPINYAVGYPDGEDYCILCGHKDEQGNMDTLMLLRCKMFDPWILMLCKKDQEKDQEKDQGPQIYELDPNFNDETWNSSSAKTTIRDVIFTPTIVECATPQGGGSQIHAPNLLSPFVTETFTVKESDLSPEGNTKICKRFQLSMQKVSLVNADGKVIHYNEWMNNNGGSYWNSEDGVRKLTVAGAAALQKSIKVEVYVISGNDEYYDWKDVTGDCFKEGTSNFENTEVGALWIPAAKIGVSPIEGEPNVRITYMRNYNEYWDGLSQFGSCDKAVHFGVGGYKDRVFLAGGNRIYYSGMDDNTYFGELNYIEPCSGDKSIVAMGGQGQVLYAVDSDGITSAITGIVTEDDANTYVSDAVFVISDRVQGEKPVGSVLKVFGGEFCYLSEEGVVAIRHDNFYDKRYAQNRSRMLGNTVKGEIIVDATVWNNFLVIATKQKLYLLDEMQQSRLEDYKYSGIQYEVYPWEFNIQDLTIEKIWTKDENKDENKDEKLYLSVLSGEAQISLVYDPAATTDNIGGTKTEIVAQWVTPPIRLSSFYRKKNILRLALDVGEIGSAVKVEYRTDGATSYKPDEKNWRMLRNYEGRFRVFNYENINYGLWTYQTTVPKLQLIINRRPSRKCYSIQFRFTNETEDKLALSNFGFTYETEVI